MLKYSFESNLTMKEEDTDPYNVWRDYYLGIQGLFYFAQGVAMGALFFLTAFLDYLSLDVFGRIVIQAVIWAPWYLKVIFGLLSDNVPIRKYGRRKPYIFAAGILGAIGWITLGTHTVFGVLLIASGILASLGTSMSDAVIDALAVDITPPKRRGAMQGVSWGSRGLGVGISAIAVGLMADQNIWFIIYAIPGIIVSFSTFLVLLFKEKPLPETFKGVSIPEFTYQFKQRNTQLCLVFQIFAGAGLAILPIMQVFLDEGVGFDNTTIGIIFMVFSVGMFTGALVFGLLGDRISVRTTLPLTTVIYVAIIFTVLFMNLSIMQTAMIFFFFVGFSNGGYEATQMRISMDYSPRIVSGTMYNLYNSLSNLGQIAIGAIAIAALVEVLQSYQIGWQVASVFLLVGLYIGHVLVSRYRPVGVKDDQDYPLPEVPQFED
ncbi:MFS transporter [Candidatus Thorarchaeota archaeon]|nr:MAG: MFS transporter [Candidatus Thorarchaeota archaeon]